MAPILWSILIHVLMIGGFLLGIVLIAHILLQKRSPSGTIAWLLIILLVPYAGVPLYLFFGGRKMRRQAASKHELGFGPDLSIPEDEAHIFDKMLRTYHIPGAQTGHTIRLCGNGVERFEAMDQLIRNARRSVFLETFIYHDDEGGPAFSGPADGKGPPGRRCAGADGRGGFTAYADAVLSSADGGGGKGERVFAGFASSVSRTDQFAQSPQDYGHR
jgi:hypothetical protein